MTTIILALVYSAALVFIATTMYRGWRQERKMRRYQKEFRDYIRRTYGRDGDKKSWDQ